MRTLYDSLVEWFLLALSLVIVGYFKIVDLLPTRKHHPVQGYLLTTPALVKGSPWRALSCAKIPS
jgi:hypothetical protein